MTFDELETVWNTKSGEFKHWDDLDLDEIVEFAQAVEREACEVLANSYGHTETEMAIRQRSRK